MYGMGYVKGEDRYQTIMFPDSIDEYITSENPARVIDAYVEGLDMENLNFKYAKAANTGRPPYNPKDMLKLYIYGYLNRIRSSRRLEDEANRNIEVMWLLKKLKPDFKTIADFRKDNKKALINVFREFNKLCDEWDLFGKELVAIDGSKFRACNSKKNNYSVKKLERHIKYIDEKIDKYLKELDQGDSVESADRKPDAEEVKKRLEELKARKDKYQGYKDELKEKGENEISTTDPDAKLMSHNNNSVEVSYNIQTTVDSKHNLIVDFKETKKPNDMGELDNMSIRTKKIFGGKKFKVLADKGYYKVEDLKRCVRKGITPYVARQAHSNRTGDRDFYPDKFTYDKEKDVYYCPAGKELFFARERRSKEKGVIGRDYRNYEACKECEYKNRCTQNIKGRSIFRHADQDFLDTINIEKEDNKEIYKLRQMIVEHPFGTIKRSWGAYYFLTKGKNSVGTEISMSFLAYNLKRVMNIIGVEEMVKILQKRGKPALI